MHGTFSRSYITGPTLEHSKYHYTVIWKLFDIKYFIDNKAQGKIFLWIHAFFEILLPWTYIASDNSYYCGVVFDHGKNYYITYNYYTIATLYHI